MATIYSNNETININPTDDLVLYKEEFINSRIEKFLYAICALDFDDLPTPLSRIEELYKCLATGLPAPTFVPQSRVEKYLMAILGSYDASDLPAPQSRTEVLLKKILMGDTDLSDIEWLKSRYEFLLAYIAKSGEISSGSGDYPYLTFLLESVSMDTLYNTKELPVKSAVLKGQTLLNVENYTPIVSNWAAVEDGDYFILTASGDWTNAFTANTNKVKSSTRYLIIVDVAENTIESTGNHALQLCTNQTNNSQSVWPYKENNTAVVPLGFTGQLRFVCTTLDDVTSKKILQRAFLDAKATSGHIKYRYMIIEYQDGMENWDIPYFEGIGSVKMPVLTTSNKDDTKTNILSTSEEVELRGIGDVQDELNLLTSELTQRIGEAVFDGSTDEKWRFQSINEYGIANFLTKIPFKDIPKILCNSLIEQTTVIGETTTEGIYMQNNQSVYVRILSSKASTTELFKEYLQSNPITVQYELAEESVKTVDLSVVDQDGNEAELSSFEDITHVTVTSEGILPDVELSVANQFEEDLATLSLRMNNIATTQEGLEESVDEQTQEVDSTMMATTEIYEQIL